MGTVISAKSLPYDSLLVLRETHFASHTVARVYTCRFPISRVQHVSPSQFMIWRALFQRETRSLVRQNWGGNTGIHGHLVQTHVWQRRRGNRHTTTPCTAGERLAIHSRRTVEVEILVCHGNLEWTPAEVSYLEV